MEKNELYSNIISIIWGIGLAVLFRQACKKRNCYFVKGPIPEELNSNYKFNDKCYKYESEAVSCPT